jgi:hypothetical protein
MTCILCDNPAIAAIRPDLDLTGIGYCKEHEDQVKLGYLLMLQGEKDVFEKMTTIRKKKEVK